MTNSHADSHIAKRARALERMLENRGVIEGPELDNELDAFLAGSVPSNGARIIARAWVDTEFKGRLLKDANTAIRDIGLSMDGGLRPQLLQVVENTEVAHNVIVCTLCSCYPIALLGPSPYWYKSESYRSRVVREPRAVLGEFGLDLPDDVEIRVWDASAETRYMVLPRMPSEAKDLDEEQLAGLVTRNGMIGTAAI